MNMYFVEGYLDYPVLFKTLKAESGAAAFGIFCVVFFSCFAFRFCGWYRSYLEEKVWNESEPYSALDTCCDEEGGVSRSQQVETCCDTGKEDCCDDPSTQQEDCCAAGETCCDTAGKEDCCDPPESCCDTPVPASKTTQSSGQQGSFWRRFLFPGRVALTHDVIRLVLSFLSAVFGYALMLVAMTYILLYFFAICLGLAFSDLFFFRLSRALDMTNSSSSKVCGSCG